ncbi:hypothetical protein ACF1BQ_029390 [Bradyrhizobium sp. RDT10]
MGEIAAERTRGCRPVAGAGVEATIHNFSQSFCRNGHLPSIRRFLREVCPAGASDLALQLRSWKVSESMGNHDSEIVDAGSVD